MITKFENFATNQIPLHVFEVRKYSSKIPGILPGIFLLPAILIIILFNPTIFISKS